MVVSTCYPFIGKSFPYISCLSLHGLHEESTLLWYTGYADTRFLVTFSAYAVSVSSGQHLMFNEAMINPGGHYSVASGKYMVRINPGGVDITMWLVEI